MNSATQFVLTVIAYVVPILLAIVLREVFHARVARFFGDHRLAEAGRTSFNPLKHIDPFGTVLLPLALVYAGMMPFGYPKPLPPEAQRLGEVSKYMTPIALSGVLANFLMGIAWALFLMLLLVTESASPFLALMGKMGMGVNAAMVVFNLLPVPPFDGGRALAGMLPLAFARRLVQIEYYGLYIAIGLFILLNIKMFQGFFLAARSRGNGSGPVGTRPRTRNVRTVPLPEP